MNHFYKWQHCTTSGSQEWHTDFGVYDPDKNPEGISPYSTCTISASEYEIGDNGLLSPFIGDARITVCNISPSIYGKLYFTLNVEYPTDIHVALWMSITNTSWVFPAIFA
jgi:hypothetical protein